MSSTSAQKRGVVGQTFHIGKVVIGGFCHHALMPALEKLIPQGASELANAIFQGHAFMPYGPTNRPVEKPDEPEHGVHGPPKTPEERAAELVALEEAKTAERTKREIDREVSDMSPEEQQIARNFRGFEPPDIDMEH
jgi:hypothetical protein